jgi:hypothetical protein
VNRPPPSNKPAAPSGQRRFTRRWSRSRLPLAFLLASLGGGAALQAAPTQDCGAPWKRHDIDDASRGADGVRLADANRDGRLDIVTGWEEGGAVRICLNPGPASIRERWPSVAIGRAPDVEDAVFVDLDRDGALDVVSCAEGSTRTLFVHWAPADGARLNDPSAWQTQALPASRQRMMWMFAMPVSLRGGERLDLVAGGKGAGACIGWWAVPDRPRQLDQWQWHPLREAGWIMSLVAEDMDGDGDPDILFSDRKQQASGCYWLENPRPGGGLEAPWPEHGIGARGREVMFLTVTDLDQDGLRDVVTAVKPRELHWFRRLARNGRDWALAVIPFPPNSGTAKAVSAGDLDGDGRAELVFTCEEAVNGASGVMALSRRGPASDSVWAPIEISGADGVKHDLVELLDLDGDGDLDVLTCEEKRNLGVIWYENPLR